MQAAYGTADGKKLASNSGCPSARDLWDEAAEAALDAKAKVQALTELIRDELRSKPGAAVYSKTFLETLARHNADSLASAVHDRLRQNGKRTELIVGTEYGAAATLVITASTPDEARLALLDLDVTAPELRGKELRWNKAAGTWRPSEALTSATLSRRVSDSDTAKDVQEHTDWATPTGATSTT